MCDWPLNVACVACFRAKLFINYLCITPAGGGAAFEHAHCRQKRAGNKQVTSNQTDKQTTVPRRAHSAQHAPHVLHQRRGRAGVHPEGAALLSHTAHIVLHGRSTRQAIAKRATLSAPGRPPVSARTCLSAAQKEAPDGRPTESAHPARFSPDDKFSKQRLICKKRFGLLPMQRPSVPL